MIKNEKNNCLFCCPVPTSRGTFHAGFSKKGLLFFSFPNTGPKQKAVKTDLSPEQKIDFENRKIKLTLWVEHYLQGNEEKPLPVKLDFSGFSDFRKDVTKQILAVKRGHVISYGRLALSSRQSKNFARAVAGVCRRNPFPLLVPCHRIVASGGKSGGFSAGPEWKAYLLGLEQEKHPE